MTKRINMKNFIKVNLDCTPYLEESEKNFYKNPNSDACINYYFRAYNPVVYYNGINVYTPDTKNPDKIGMQIPEHVLTKEIKDDLNNAWANR